MATTTATEAPTGATRRVFKWFWAWNDHHEEAWLRGMARQGWHLQRVPLPSLFTFERGARRDTVYRLDFRWGYWPGRPGWEEYHQLFADAGWEYVDNMGSWIYFRKEPAPGEPDEIYTDGASKARKYQSLLTFVALVLCWLLLVVDLPEGSGGTLEVVLTGLLAALTLLYVYAMVRLWLRVRSLRRRL